MKSCLADVGKVETKVRETSGCAFGMWARVSDPPRGAPTELAPGTPPTRIVTLGSERSAVIWSVSTGEVLQVLPLARFGRHQLVRVFSDGKRLLTGRSEYRDDPAVIWDLASQDHDAHGLALVDSPRPGKGLDSCFEIGPGRFPLPSLSLEIHLVVSFFFILRFQGMLGPPNKVQTPPFGMHSSLTPSVVRGVHL